MCECLWKPRTEPSHLLGAVCGHVNTFMFSFHFMCDCALSLCSCDYLCTLACALGEASPIATFLREQLVSPSSARRQLFSPSSTTSSKKTPGKLGSGTPTRPIPIAPKPAVGSSGGTSGGVGGGTVTVTLLRDYLQQQHSSISQQLQGAISPGTSPSSGGSPGRLDPASPLRLAVSMASAGTQTSPCRPLSSTSSAPPITLSMAGLLSPGRNLSAIAQVSLFSCD